jgi:hypothetical protein
MLQMSADFSRLNGALQFMEDTYSAKGRGFTLWLGAITRRNRHYDGRGLTAELECGYQLGEYDYFKNVKGNIAVIPYSDKPVTVEGGGFIVRASISIGLGIL